MRNLLAITTFFFIFSCTSNLRSKRVKYLCDSREFSYSHVEFILNTKDSSYTSLYEYRISLQKGKEKVTGNYKIVNEKIIFTTKLSSTIINPFLECKSVINTEGKIVCIDTLAYSPDSIFTRQKQINETYIMYKIRSKK